MRAMPTRLFDAVRGRRAGETATPPPWALDAPVADERIVDLERRREQLATRVAELQWDLGGLAYEMAVRDRIAVELLVQRAAVLQEADAELAEVERILHTEQTGTAGACGACGAPHSSGAVFCWQCGQPLLAQVASDAIGTP
jgi:hypothetical protein